MHDMIFAVAFIAMVATPAMVAVIGGRKEYNPGSEALPAAPARFAKPVAPRQATPPVNVPKPFIPKRPLTAIDPGTLPVHRPRGLGNR